jgi:alpha-amylase
MQSVHEIDLTPKAGKKYWTQCQREWREEFIYFLLVDRFHDDHNRAPILSETRHSGFGNPDQLKKNCGGTLKGITRHLEYIHNLGCTALWLSPVFENNPESYHGYAIQNYLDVDKRFGTKAELEELVDKAHALNMRVFLDIVLHHSGDNWFYPNDAPYYYYQDIEFPLAGWRYENRPIPIELRDPKLYNRMGAIRNFESYPETSHGDFMALKTFRNDDSPEALHVQDILIKIHSYWMREVDIDGYRIDAVKHMGEVVTSRFCSHIREYAYSLGKRNFFLFGELVGPEEMYNRYMGSIASTFQDYNTIYYGLDSVLDFDLYHTLPAVITGQSSPAKLIARYESLRKSAANRGEYGEYLVTFLDNHDQVDQVDKHRFGRNAKPEQIIAGVSFLLCTQGTPCIYYGTEQGLEGLNQDAQTGHDDWRVREAMFSLTDSSFNILDHESMIYKGISKIAWMRKDLAPLRFGRMYICKVSTDGIFFHYPDCPNCLLAFSRVLQDEEILIAYNISTTERREEYVTVGNKGTGEFRYLSGDTGKVKVETNPDVRRNYVKLSLQPMQFVILSNS